MDFIPYWLQSLGSGLSHSLVSFESSSVRKGFSKAASYNRHEFSETDLEVKEL